MKNYRIVTTTLITILFFLQTAQSANAQIVNQSLREKINNRQQIIQVARENLALKHAQRLEIRFNLYNQKLDAIIIRIQTALTSASEEGINIDPAQSKLDEAKKSLIQAKNYADHSVAQFSEIDTNDYQAQKEEAVEARNLANLAREEFKNTIQLLRESVKLAKQIIKEAKSK